MRKRMVLPLVALVALIAVTTATESWRRGRLARMAADAAVSTGAPEFEPYPLEPFAATDIDGRDVGTSSWAKRVVVLNVWATWCAPCRREIPALSALQTSYTGRVLVLGVLDDNVTDDFARAFAASLRMTYPIVRTSFELERRFPVVAVLPMTFIIDAEGRLARMYAGEIDPARVDHDIRTLLGEAPRSPSALVTPAAGGVPR